MSVDRGRGGDGAMTCERACTDAPAGTAHGAHADAATHASSADARVQTATARAAGVNNAGGVQAHSKTAGGSGVARPSKTAARAADRVTHCFTLSDPTLAWLIVNRKKTLENRRFRLGEGWYAVHVGKGATADAEAACRLRRDYPEMPEPDALPRGCVYGVCKIVGAMSAAEARHSRWYVEPYPWANVIGDVVRFDAPAGRAMSGNLGVVPLKGWADEVCAAVRRAVAAQGGGTDEAWLPSEPCRRPPEQDVLLGHNEWAYASRARLNGQWMGALFARRDIPAGTAIVEYRGPIMSEARAREEPEDGNQYMLTARRKRDGRLVTIDGTPTTGTGNLAGYANYACDGAANARLSDEAGAPPPGHEGPTYVVIRAESAVEAGTEIRIDYDLAQRCAAARSAGRGKRQCTERTRAPRLPYQEQLLRRGVAMEQLNDMTYKDVRWCEPPTLTGVLPGRDEATAGRVPRGRGQAAKGCADPARATPTKDRMERGRKRRNTVSRWDGGAGVPGQDVTAAGQTARAEGVMRGGGGAV